MTALLIVLVAAVFVIPVIAPSGTTGEIVNDVSLTLVLLSAAAAIAERQSVQVLAVLLCLFAVVLRWLEWLVPSSISLLVREGSALLALALVTGIVATRVFAGGTVTVDRIMGAVVLYLLLGIACAAAYELVAIHVADAFIGGDIHAKGPVLAGSTSSFVTLTTVGYGDITPVARAARSLAALEALIGQLYPAIILARLVSLRAEARKSGQ
jgi:hypothetical protein